MEAVLRKWHKSDPVDNLEITRNDVIYTEFQHNRNPFIDYPEWVDQINDF
jgi:endonuclease I